MIVHGGETAVAVQVGGSLGNPWLRPSRQYAWVVVPQARNPGWVSAARVLGSLLLLVGDVDIEHGPVGGFKVLVHAGEFVIALASHRDPQVTAVV